VKVYLDTGTWGRVLDDPICDRTLERDLGCLDGIFEAVKQGRLTIMTSEANEDELAFLSPEKREIVERVREVATCKEDSQVTVFGRSRFGVARFSDEKAAKLNEALREKCGIGWPDAHQLVGGIYHSAEAFLTIAKDLLGKGRQVEESLGLRVLHACRFAREIVLSDGEEAT
jgi:hypothetical protein